LLIFYLFTATAFEPEGRIMSPVLRRASLSAAVACAVASTAHAGVSGRPYYFDNVMSGGNTTTFMSPVINNHGSIAFEATVYQQGRMILTGPNIATDAFINTADPNGPYSSFASGFQMNDMGDIAFTGTPRGTQESGLFVNLDPTNLMTGRSGGFGPVAINNSGQVLISNSLGLYTYNPRRNHNRVLLGQKGSSTTQVLAENTFFGPPENFRTLDSGFSALNNSGQVAHLATSWTDTGYGYIGGIYRGNTRDTAYVETDGQLTGSPLFDTDGWLDMNDSGDMAFMGSFDDSLFTDKLLLRRADGTITTFAIQNGEIVDVNWVDLNNNGEVAFGSYGNGGNGIFVGPGGLSDRVIGPGDTLFGKTVRDAYMRRGGFNDNGVVAFQYITTNPTESGIAIGTPALPGDINGDRTVNLGDFATLAANFNGAGNWLKGDFNRSETVTLADFAMLASNFNQTFHGGTGARGAVPEPAAALLLVAATTFLRRRG
jgi:hypothetical protein